MLILAVSSLLNALYFIRTQIRIYSAGESDPFGRHRQKAADPMVILPSLVLAFGNLFLGLFSRVAVDLILQGLSHFG